jgi:ketosteroid isomerase-like protein
MLVPSAGEGRAAAPDTAAAAANLETLVAAERAFAAASVERGMKQAFLENLAPDAIVFAPHPLNGHKRWAARPASKATLTWAPAYAEASASGDLGLSLGPWELRPPDANDDAVIHGTFVTVWKREGDGPWRVAIDHGVSHPKPERGPADVVFEPGPLHVLDTRGGSGSGAVFGGVVVGRHLGFGAGFGSYISPGNRALRSAAHEAHRMMSAERNYAFTLRRKGADEALHVVAADGVRLLREGARPARGLVEAAETLASQPQRVEWLPSGRDVSGALDLGYSYGLARRWASGASRPDTSGYFHVWRREPEGDWKLIVDVETPFPKP